MVSNEFKTSYKFFFSSTPDDDISIEHVKKLIKNQKIKKGDKKNEQKTG